MNKSQRTCSDFISLSLENIQMGQTVRALGNDIVSISRIAALLSHGGDSFMKRTFTASEIEECLGKANPPNHFAGRFAAKEAVFKSLKLQWNRPFSWKEIEVLSGADRAPQVLLSQTILDRCPRGQSPELLVSISHCTEYAFAVALVLSGGTKDSDGKN